MAYLTRLNLAVASINPANHSVDNTKPRVPIAIRSASFGLSPHNREALSLSSLSTSTPACLRPLHPLRLVSFGIQLLGRRFLKGITLSFTQFVLLATLEKSPNGVPPCYFRLESATTMLASTRSAAAMALRGTSTQNLPRVEFIVYRLEPGR